MKRLFVLSVLWTLSAQAIDLTQYPFRNEPSPADFVSLSAEDALKAKKLTTDYVLFLFESGCEADGSGAKTCLWAFVDTLFDSKIVIQLEADPKRATLYRISDVKGSFKYEKSRQFVRLFELPESDKAAFLAGVDVNGKSLLVSHWSRLIGDQGPYGPMIPVMWLPVTEENQKKVDAQIYRGLHTNPKKEVKLLYSDMHGEKAAPGEAFFVIVGYEMAEPKLQSHHFVARRHSTEKDTFTGTMHMARIVEGVATLFPWMGYTISTVGDQPESFEALKLESEPPTPVRGKVVSP